MTQLKYYLNTHIHFDIAYNGEQSHVTSDKITATIVGVNASTHPSDVKRDFSKYMDDNWEEKKKQDGN